jgi:polyhydroxybutyrate depolymerase
MPKAALRSTALAAIALLSAAHSSAIGTPPPADPAARTIRVGAMTRHFIVYAPPSLKPGSPLLLAFHPSGSSGPGMRRLCGDLLERMARERGFVVAYPTGFEGHFDDLRLQTPYSARRLKIDDVGFARAIVDLLVREYALDNRRVYALGYSNGGAMVLRLAVQAPDLVAGVISIAASFPTADNIGCTFVEGRHTAVVLIEGTADPINPYLGGRVSLYGIGNRGTVLSAWKSAEWFAHRYGLDPVPSPERVLKQGTLTATWQDWGGSRPLVRLITIQGGGHTIPKAARPAPKIIVGHTFRSDALIEGAWEMISGSG